MSKLPYELGALYHRVSQIHEPFGGQRQGGISTPTSSPYVFIFTGDSGKPHGYEDRWDEADGLFHYVGEGQVGPMQMKGGNGAILRHDKEDKRLLLFRMLGKGRPYRFEGEFLVVDHYVLPNVPDTKRNPRDAIVFRLRPLDPDPLFESAEDPSEVDVQIQTSSQRTIEVRTKQQLFRRRLLGYERECRLTGVRDLRFVRASHIKPWSKATSSERVDGCNGLLLTPTADHLFDQGWISFTNAGQLLCSRFLSRNVGEHLGLDLRTGRKCGSTFLATQRGYLEYHRDEVFEKKQAREEAPY